MSPKAVSVVTQALLPEDVDTRLVDVEEPLQVAHAGGDSLYGLFSFSLGAGAQDVALDKAGEAGF